MAASVVLIPTLAVSTFQMGSGGRADSLRVTATVRPSTFATEDPPVDWHARYNALWAKHQRLIHRSVKIEKQRNRVRAALRGGVRLGASGLERAFLCIHNGEGSWRDPNAPYFGGLQMDYGFMRSYGAPFLRAFGPANNWTPAMQLSVGERAYLSGRGFYPWPNTARYCGLLP